MFYTYNQNNSGGGFDFDAERGISHYVIVEAQSANFADARAEDIGLYFDGEGDCPCCGDRWSSQGGWFESEGDAEPSVYGTVIENGVLAEGKYSMKWMSGPEGFIHYLDGRVEAFDYAT